jgi:hypothetical protein
MKTLLSRILATALVAAVAWVLLAVACAPRMNPIEPDKLVIRSTEPDKLVILSTTDVKGKTDPCG